MPPRPAHAPLRPSAFAPVCFDRIARTYRWLEHLTLGRTLTRTRSEHLNALRHSRHALVLGDGDGRFLQALLRSNPTLTALALDSSRVMLRLLTRRCHFAAGRLRTLHADALSTLRPPAPSAPPTFDLVVTHFFLDCFTTAELERLLPTIRAHLLPGALWVISEFRIPPRGPLRPLAQLLVRSLYLAFRLLTGLRPSHLPPYRSLLHAAGLVPLRFMPHLGGILSSELWQLPPHPTLQRIPMAPTHDDRAPIEPIYDIDPLIPLPPAPVIIPGEVEHEIVEQEKTSRKPRPN